MYKYAMLLTCLTVLTSVTIVTGTIHPLADITAIGITVGLTCRRNNIMILRERKNENVSTIKPKLS